MAIDDLPTQADVARLEQARRPTPTWPSSWSSSRRAAVDARATGRLGRDDPGRAGPSPTSSTGAGSGAPPCVRLVVPWPPEASRPTSPGRHRRGRRTLSIRLAERAAPGPRRMTRPAPLPARVGDARSWRDPAAAPSGPGAVVFFTGLSGSGKSTIARALADELADEGPRRVTLLDGDEVRQHLSRGLGFDAASREINVDRIAWVASLVAAHGGIAVAAPIAPFAAGRRNARALAEAARRVPARLGQHAARRVRGARPQGPLRAGPRRRGRRLHRDLVALRGARRRRPRDRHDDDDRRAGDRR